MNKGSSAIGSLAKVGDTYTFTIERVGQSVTVTVEHNGESFTKTFVDFDFLARDSQYMYIGMFANRGTVVKFTNVNFTITGISQGA